jgi:hypothetical protein
MVRGRLLSGGEWDLCTDNLLGRRLIRSCPMLGGDGRGEESTGCGGEGTVREALLQSIFQGLCVEN